MSLSSIITTLPKYQITLPVTGMKVEYRPFIVKEEKILLMAAETKDERSMISAVKDVVLSCTNGKVNISDLPTTDMEYLFLQLRSSSIGETVSPMVKCDECKTPNEVTINLKEIKPTSHPNHDKKIHLIQDIYVIMKHPTISDLEKIGNEGNEVDRALRMIVKCIDKVINGDTVYNTAEMDMNEVKDFVENLTQVQFNKLIAFVESMPSVETKVTFDCKKCGHHNSISLKGIANFF
jgi:hypothetical protein